MVRISHLTVELARGDLSNAPIIHLCRSMARAFPSIEISLVTTSDTKNSWRLDDNITAHTIRTSNVVGGRLDYCSFDLYDALLGSALVHIHEPFTRLGEGAFVSTRNIGARSLLSCDGDRVGSNAWKWGMAQLADVLICWDDKEAGELRSDTNQPIHVVPDFRNEQAAGAERFEALITVYRRALNLVS